MSVIQWFIFAFALFAISRALRQFRSGTVGFAGVILWTLFWIAAMVVTALPQTTDYLAGIVGIGRGADFIIYLSLIFLFYAVFRLFVKLEDMEKALTRLVRKRSLEQASDDLKHTHDTIHNEPDA